MEGISIQPCCGAKPRIKNRIKAVAHIITSAHRARERAGSGRLGSLFATSLATKTRDEFAAVHRKGVGFHGSPFVVTVAAQRLVGLFLVRSREW